MPCSNNFQEPWGSVFRYINWHGCKMHFIGFEKFQRIAHDLKFWWWHTNMTETHFIAITLLLSTFHSILVIILYLHVWAESSSILLRFRNERKRHKNVLVFQVEMEVKWLNRFFFVFDEYQAISSLLLLSHKVLFYIVLS